MVNGSLRIFVAIDVPDGEVKEKITEFQKKLIQTGADLKLVEPENIHITLRFLGDTQISLVEKLKLELGAIRFSPFKIVLREVGAFPDLNRINVVWIGIGEGNLALIDLWNKVNRSLTNCGVPMDRRGFSPHLTVARVRSGRNKDALSKTIIDLSDFEFGAFEADSFTLKQSILTPAGPIYRNLKRVVADQTVG
ncbi:MAG: RNA 2',3'-cyclic phosphodiesterase [Candidatus Bathyarchaeia archaeon]